MLCEAELQAKLVGAGDDAYSRFDYIPSSILMYRAPIAMEVLRLVEKLFAKQLSTRMVEVLPDFVEHAGANNAEKWYHFPHLAN